MSHTRDGDHHTFSCDGCPEAEEGEDFRRSWARLKKLGWVTFRSGGEWRHRCPSCAEEGLL